MINVFKEKNLNHFARVKRDRKDEISVESDPLRDAKPMELA